jgi:hypothetical protein
MVFSWLTWLGLLVAALGWIFPWLAPLRGDRGAEALAGGIAAALSAGSVPQNMILTGFGIAILGALQTGFGALDRFFAAILERSGRASSAADTLAQKDDDVVERGRIGGRGFVRYADGSVEVETLLGVRRFDSLEDARGFVGS